jgi:hypothetical protein
LNIKRDKECIENDVNSSINIVHDTNNSSVMLHYLYSTMHHAVLIVAFVACLIGLIIDRYILLKFFICYETLLFTISVIMLILSVDINVMIVVFYLLLNSTFEVILGLSILLVLILLINIFIIH